MNRSAALFFEKFNNGLLSVEASSKLNRTSKMELLQKWLTLFLQIFILGVDYMDIFSPSSNFNSLNYDKISSRILSSNSVKKELRLNAKISSR